jgi:hypothetical protein
MAVYFLAYVAPGEFQAVCCKRNEASWSTVRQASFSLVLGVTALW